MCISLAQLLSRGRTLSGRVGRRELDRKRDFRVNIAEDLRDIAQAFRPRTLTILVDDLDRCQPKVVVSLLEAIGFLISNLDCFIIVGMARDYVERSVVLEMLNRNEFLLEGHDECEHIGDEQAQKMRGFSNQYLNKLINVEISLPEVPAEQASSRLIDFSLAANKVEQRRVRDTLQVIWRNYRKHAWVLKLTLALLVVFSAGVYLTGVVTHRPCRIGFPMSIPQHAETSSCYLLSVTSREKQFLVRFWRLGTTYEIPLACVSHAIASDSHRSLSEDLGIATRATPLKLGLPYRVRRNFHQPKLSVNDGFAYDREELTSSGWQEQLRVCKWPSRPWCQRSVHHREEDLQRTKLCHETLRVIGLVRPKGESRTRAHFPRSALLDIRLTLDAAEYWAYRVAAIPLRFSSIQRRNLRR